MNLKERRAAALKTAQTLIDGAKTSARDLTDNEATQVEGKFAEIADLDAQIARQEKSSGVMTQLLGGKAPQGESDEFSGPASKGAGSPWAKSVMGRLTASATTTGVKALLTGEISTPSAVGVVGLPDVPTRLLDLVPREALEENHYSYLRQTVKTNNAATVADNALKPTSVYTFDEVEDRARVIAHLSEPFPIRYADDHASMLQVLDGQMRAGIEAEIERLLVEGTGTGEEWTGILTATGTTAVAFATDVLTSLRKARTALENKGEPVTGVAMNPTDIEALDLLREGGTTGGFLVDGSVFERIFGPGVRGVPSVAVPVGQAIVGNWATTRLRIRENSQTLAATQAGDLFAKNQMMLRTEGRFNLDLLRPQGLAVVDLVAG